ncbi:MAG TPA: hypothetical protein VE262_23685 [Blastocatellia bacterium]|nr:hypothetical protein [Blastocatellia bacterium]
MARPAYEDKIWVDSDRKLSGICDDISLSRAGDVNVLVIAHFESTLSAVEAKLRGESIEHHSFFPGDYAALCGGGVDKTAKVWLALAPYFQPRAPMTSEGAGREGVCVLFAEHHPMASKDRSLIEALARMPCRSKVIFHAALTDGLLSHFGGEKLQDLLKRLGHKENACLSHPLVTGVIQRAQEKIDKQVDREIPARSEQEWFKYNMAGGA